MSDIRKKNKRPDHFWHVDAKLMELPNEEFNAEAKILYGYIRSRPDDWKIRRSALLKLLGSKHRLEKAIKKLKDTNLLSITRLRGDNNLWEGYTWEIGDFIDYLTDGSLENDDPDAPIGESPKPDNRVTAEPSDCAVTRLSVLPETGVPDLPTYRESGNILRTELPDTKEIRYSCPPSVEDVQTPKDKKAVLAQLMQKTEEKYSQTKQGKKTPKRKLYDFWNHCFYQKYGMRQEFDVKQDQNYQKLIDLTGDFDKAKKLVEFYIENYETLPFVNTLSYKRPLIKGLLVFALDVNDMMNEPTADLDESTPDTEEQQQALQDYLEREAKQKAIQETHAQLGKLAQEAFEQLSSTFVSNEAFASRLKQTSSLYTLSKANGALSFVNMQTIVDGVYELKTGHKYSEQEKSIFNRLTQLKRDSRLPDDVRFMKLTYKEEVENFYKLITSSKELDFSKVKISSDPIFSDDHVYLVDRQDTFEETIFEVLKQIPVLSSRLMVGGGNLRTYLSLIAKMAFENGEAYVSFAGIGKI